MKEIAEKKAHHGTNIKYARIFKNVTQQDLADRVNLQQSDISKLENSDTIDDEILQTIALALDMPLEFFKSFDADTLVKSYINTSNGNEGQVSVFQGENEIEQNNTIFPLEKVSELYELRVIDAKTIGALEEKVNQLKKEIDTLKKK